jgi:hypothetical protein
MAAAQQIFKPDEPVDAPIATAQAVTAGDLVAMLAGTLVRAEDETWVNDLLTTQENFASKFLGVSEQTKAANIVRIFGNSVDNEVRVDTSGIWEFDCAATSWNLGDLAGAAKASGNNLVSNAVAKVTVKNACVGVAVRKQNAVTRVRLKMLSNIIPDARTIY